MTVVRRGLMAAAAVAVFGLVLVRAGAGIPSSGWSATDVAGVAVKVPSAERSSVLLFYRYGQGESDEATRQLKDLLGGKDLRVQVVVVVSGPGSSDSARKLIAERKWDWPVVADTEYSACGQMSVHVWPTTLVVGKDGKLLGQVAGLPATFSRDIEAYVSFAGGKINADEVARRKEDHATVIDSDEQIVHRHIEVAQRLLDKGQAAQAEVELAEAMKHPVASSEVRLMAAEVCLLEGNAERAIELLDSMDAAQRAKVPEWRLAFLRARGLILQGKWEAAKAMLLDATRLSPDSADGHYLLGMVYQHEADWRRAAEAFRQGFEATAAGRRLSMPANSQK
jgi:Tfp pilus assembly protein PilF